MFLWQLSVAGALFFSSSYNEVHDPVACFILYSVSHNFSILDCKSMREFSMTFAVDLKKEGKKHNVN